MPSINHFRRNKHDIVCNEVPKNNDFRCPECVSADEDGDFFCSFNRCPEQIPQPKFPSANSSFPPEELAEINECIEQANELLLTLGLERDSENNLRTLQLSLRKLRNQCVTVLVNCNEGEQQLQGHFIDAGLNFIILETNVGNTLLIPFERMILLEHPNQIEIMDEPKQELIDIDPCLRRSLTFNFSEVVAKSPFLINLFYGLELTLFLESFIGCFAYVKSDNSIKEKDGILDNVNKRRVELIVDNEKQGIDFDELCFIEIEQQALTRKFLLFNKHPIIE